MKIETGFKAARLASEKANYHLQHLGAAIYYKGALLALGYNTEKTHPMQKHYNKYRDFEEEVMPAKMHAEMMALNKIKNLDIDFTKTKLFIWRGRDEQHPQLSRPCPACEAAIKAMGIKNIYYTGNGSLITEQFV